jgi:hypothetical protein
MAEEVTLRPHTLSWEVLKWVEKEMAEEVTLRPHTLSWEALKRVEKPLNRDRDRRNIGALKYE